MPTGHNALVICYLGTWDHVPLGEAFHSSPCVIESIVVCQAHILGQTGHVAMKLGGRSSHLNVLRKSLSKHLQGYQCPACPARPARRGVPR